jgi:hypothetical protein
MIDDVPAVTQPLVTFAVMAYAQAAMVQEAIDAAFAQTYSPLEILLSDDHSPDGTFQIMQAAAQSYRGPHRVVLNRNATNLGLISHVNRLFELATGDLIIYNAGDDVSVPDRTAKIVALQSLTQTRLVHSNVTDIGPDGTELRTRQRDRHAQLAAKSLAEVATTKNNGIGAAFAWHKDLYRAFGPITETAAIEDRVLYFRARLLGDVGYIDEPLVRYRRGIGLSFTTVSGPDGERKSLLRDIATFRQRIADCTIAASVPDRTQVLDVLRKKLNRRLRELDSLTVAAAPEPPGSVGSGEAALRATTPVFINSFNQPTYLRDMIGWFKTHGFHTVTVLDNASTSAELLDYYVSDAFLAAARVLHLGTNMGPRRAVAHVRKVLCPGQPFVFSDPDLALQDPAPEFLTRMFALATSYDRRKVGLALDLSDAEKFNSDKVVIKGAEWSPAAWEDRYWKTALEADVYDAPVDTTFFLEVPPTRPTPGRLREERLPALRVAGTGFTAKHRPWYIDDGLPDAERAFYRASASRLASWSKTAD